MTFSKKLLLLAFFIPAVTFVSCDLEALLEEICDSSSTLTYCLDFKAIDSETGEDLISNGTFKTSDLTIKAQKASGDEYIVFDGSYGSAYDESVFIDFGDADDANAIITKLIFESPSIETASFDLDIKEKKDKNCMVAYDLKQSERTACVSCQVGAQSIGFKLK